MQARRREHAGDRATNLDENVSFRCSRAPTTTCGGPPPSRREARATSSLFILLNATQRCHFVISLRAIRESPLRLRMMHGLKSSHTSAQGGWHKAFFHRTLCGRDGRICALPRFVSVGAIHESPVKSQPHPRKKDPLGVFFSSFVREEIHFLHTHVCQKLAGGFPVFFRIELRDQGHTDGDPVLPRKGKEKC